MASMENIDVEDIGALAQSNPKLYEALKGTSNKHLVISSFVVSRYEFCHYTNDASILHPFSCSESFCDIAHFASVPKATIQQSRRFSLEKLPTNTAEILAAFDFDGNGKVTLDNVRQGAQELKKSKKAHKIAVWAMIIQFLVYATLSATSVGIIYHFMDIMDDTTVDPSTGNLMVKGGNNEVSVISHGKAYTYEASAVDSKTGEEKGCISTSQAMEMFDLVVEGTGMKFIDEDQDSGDVRVLTIGANSSVWSDSMIDLGGMVLIPDVDCAAVFKGDDGNRMLSEEDVYETHIAARKEYASRKLMALPASTDEEIRITSKNLAVASRAGYKRLVVA